MFKHFGYQPNSVGYLSQYLQDYGRCIPSTLSMAEKKVVFYLRDEIFAIGVPIFVTLEAQSTAILQIELTMDRSAATWQRHFEELGKHLCYIASTWPPTVARAWWPAIKRLVKMADTR